MVPARALPSAADAYKQAALESAPPLKIVRLLYAGAIRFLDHAGRIDPLARPAEFNAKLARADAIVTELRCALDRNQAPELCERLERLYAFAEARISEAVLARSAAPIADARKVLATLLEGWEQVATQGPEAGA